jgi:hypothetical protein
MYLTFKSYIQFIIHLNHKFIAAMESQKKLIKILFVYIEILIRLACLIQQSLPK